MRKVSPPHCYAAYDALIELSMWPFHCLFLLIPGFASAATHWKALWSCAISAPRATIVIYRAEPPIRRPCPREPRYIGGGEDRGSYVREQKGPLGTGLPDRAGLGFSSIGHVGSSPRGARQIGWRRLSIGELPLLLNTLPPPPPLLLVSAAVTGAKSTSSSAS